jgi:hypothetical protein
MRGQRIFEYISLTAGMALAVLAIGYGGYLVWSVLPKWLVYFCLGAVLFLGGITLFGYLYDEVIARSLFERRKKEPPKP